MQESYVLSEYALLRKDELVDVPAETKVHPCYLDGIDRAAFMKAFGAVRALFERLLEDVAVYPARFSLPETMKDPSHMGGPAFNEARVAPDRPFYLLMYLFAHGELADGRFRVDVAGFRKANQGKRVVRNPEALLEAFASYGFVFEGLDQYKIPRSAKAFYIAFPENPLVPRVLRDAAEKCYRFINENGFVRFRTWNYRLLEQPRDILGFGSGAEHVGDSLHGQEDRAFVQAFHDRAMTAGRICQTGAWHEGPFVRYFESKTTDAYLYELMLNRGRVTLRLRIRDAGPCLGYLQQCPESVREMFRHSDRGCEKRHNGTCVASTRYVYEGEEKWRCGCWGAPFFAPTRGENIPYYEQLVTLGKKKPKARQ